MQRHIYPFTAIVGQERMKRALILNAVNPSIGGVLIRGERGTAKSTAVRALTALLPEMEVFEESPFGDDPHRPDQWSDLVRDWHAEGRELTITVRQTRMVDLPVGATEDRVVGTLDIEKAIQKGEKHFEPGILASANRGILYVDEVNLLDDHIVDLLLDSAAMGINTVEREGISFQHPARFILVGTMNPEEGELRPQLLDRFGLAVEVRGIKNTRERLEILERHIQFDTNPEAFAEEWLPREKILSEKIARARESVDHMKYTRRDLFMIAELTGSYEIDGHRADLVILKASLALAAFEGRDAIQDIDIFRAAELALLHRVKRGPFSDTTLDVTNLEERMSDIAQNADWESNADSQTGDTESGQESEKKKTLKR